MEQNKMMVHGLLYVPFISFPLVYLAYPSYLSYPSIFKYSVFYFPVLVFLLSSTCNVDMVWSRFLWCCRVFSVH